MAVSTTLRFSSVAPEAGLTIEWTPIDFNAHFLHMEWVQDNTTGSSYISKQYGHSKESSDDVAIVFEKHQTGK